MILRLSPTIENIHSFRARTDCILFDILVPNYDNSYRMCHFYKEISSTIAPILHPSKKFKQENDETGEDSLGIKGFIEGTILLEEIPEPLELQSFVVIAFPRLLTLKL